jgi:Tol biopolymer transport system component
MSRHVTRIASALLIAALALATSAASVGATSPGVNGRITFMREDADGAFQIWTANPDLSHQVQLTAGSGAAFPAWSPDGTRIAFSSGRSDPEPNDDVEIQDVFTMRADGSDIRKITESLGDAEKPAWSPDGRWLAFSTDAGGQGIYLIPSDGSGPMRLLTPRPEGTFFAELPRFSPDGTRVVFTAYKGTRVLEHHREGSIAGFAAALFVVRLDGSGLKQITPWGIHAQDADWSPDGSRIVFTGQPPHLGNIGDVMVVDADGRHLTDLTHDHGATGFSNSDVSPRYEESFNAVWSPDGTKILFVHAIYTPEAGFTLGLQTMNPDGSGRAWVSDQHGEEHQPDWGTAPLVP